eukprot:CAMPEP_0113575642 /NCGR_PEP_ID=MMETSP0015_2-20120614/27814_1 /TAXON_ID=2838 /ORGANISM="Odontella" /LENGTH=112 /DNA_ID=CAMNT_0000478909 /DNA_START=184 /DNA_END=522 /DNA_ORIENTATION=+ /assembly_acc=CAM_ASM_000160
MTPHPEYTSRKLKSFANGISLATLPVRWRHAIHPRPREEAPPEQLRHRQIRINHVPPQLLQDHPLKRRHLLVLRHSSSRPECRGAAAGRSAETTAPRHHPPPIRVQRQRRRH